MKDRWKDNGIQFPRLIEEAQAAGAFTPEVISSMSDSMDLEEEDILELLNRAQEIWDGIEASIRKS